jgi:hypothetical protein
VWPYTDRPALPDARTCSAWTVTRDMHANIARNNRRRVGRANPAGMSARPSTGARYTTPPRGCHSRVC